MARRTIDWNKGLAKDLRNKNFAREFIQASMAEGLSLQSVLNKVIKAYGLKEFAEKCGMPASNILRIVNQKHNPTIASLNRLLKPFSLALSVTSIASKEKIAA